MIERVARGAVERLKYFPTVWKNALDHRAQDIHRWVGISFNSPSVPQEQGRKTIHLVTAEIERVVLCSHARNPAVDNHVIPG
jgi:hypothetical protein